jgi:hypothetical protein
MHPTLVELVDLVGLVEVAAAVRKALMELPVL